MPAPALDPQVRGILERLVPMSVRLDALSVAGRARPRSRAARSWCASGNRSSGSVT